jgi:TRAP-type C4-dicarboxylate transport system permease large subunit
MTDRNEWATPAEIIANFRDEYKGDPWLGLIVILVIILTLAFIIGLLGLIIIAGWPWGLPTLIAIGYLTRHYFVWIGTDD